MTFQIGQSLFGEKIWGGPAFDLTPTGQQGILYTTTAIELDWTQIDEATSYDVQVSLYPDFRTTFEDTNVAFAFYNFTDGQVDDAKRYWRYRGRNAGGPFQWSEVGSYWVDTSAPAAIVLNRGVWAMADITDTTDIYRFEMFPQFVTVPQNLFRIQERNRLGELLSEFLTIKWSIALMFNGNQYLEHPQLDEFRRYHNNKRTLYLCAFIEGKWHTPIPHIWKVEFSEDPTMTMIASGRQDLLQGIINFQEV